MVIKYVKPTLLLGLVDLGVWYKDLSRKRTRVLYPISLFGGCLYPISLCGGCRDRISSLAIKLEWQKKGRSLVSLIWSRPGNSMFLTISTYGYIYHLID